MFMQCIFMFFIKKTQFYQCIYMFFFNLKKKKKKKHINTLAKSILFNQKHENT
jgi:hypothetical protein